MKSCIFCDVIAGKLPRTVIFQDTDVIVIKDMYPQAQVHLLVIPKKHISELVEVEDALLTKLFQTIKMIIKQEHIANYRIVNNGKGTAIIDHVHIHILGSVSKHRNL
ncbi:hypothetical protein A2Z00_02705 [Candidatus Gottesmanbacteria bacterium RBG_13_45_10]|uniref:HIT domain-containing protein n=1 Tax=Candidatus Gottesmanbacteria bacterium RBG_13_45_10 TaxID=1798370 RepID=A0A1F5ZG94_9BACT|nr:MAG: hypothetical protein A2Z00_02705 [Candidatus Gottesmanbacteria bacterium RBG_13_45_10]